MRSTYLLLFLLLTLQTYAKPSKPVAHGHDGRTHSHPLPAEGLAHKHGNSSFGVLLKNKINTQAGRPAPSSDLVITSSVKQAQNTHKFLRSNLLVKGVTNCKRGQADCNVCANNVQQQFNKAASQQIRWANKPWRFNWKQRYAPFGKSPKEIFDGVPAYALGIPDTHVQGFVRTNSTRYPYAGSHSHKKKGGIFVIKQERNGKKYLSSLHQTKGRHPSGVHIIGKYLVYGDGNSLIFKDINSPNQQKDIRLSIPKAGFGGGLGIVKTSRNMHLVVTSGPGGNNRRPRYHRFYRLKSINGRPSSLRFLGESASRMPNQWPAGFSFSENLSLITECGTGDIYAIHTSGDEKGVSAISGNGYWRLSKLHSSQNKLSLIPVSAFINRQNMVSCSMKASGTVHVNPQHKLEFYCHGYAKDPDGSLFNVLGRSSRGQDRFYFRVGTVK